MSGETNRIFKDSGSTYFHASRFFPPVVRSEVSTLYAFLRVADDLVDAIPQKAREFREFRAAYQRAREGSLAGDSIIDPFVELMGRRGLRSEWVADFLDAMEGDLTKRTYDTLEELLTYVHGAAEVVGLFMTRILGLPDEAQKSAALLGRSMQYINFLRDIREDGAMGRRYLPLGDSGLESLEEAHVRTNRGAFEVFMRRQTDLYRQFQSEAAEGWRYLPRPYLIPIKTASELLNWTASVIRRDPLVVYRRKVKPGRLRILGTLVWNGLVLGRG